jgi:hypothetical protein
LKNRWKKIGRNLKKSKKWGEKALKRSEKGFEKGEKDEKRERRRGKGGDCSHRAELVLVSIAFEDGFNILAKFPSLR